MRELTELLRTAPARRLLLADACFAGLALPSARQLRRADRSPKTRCPDAQIPLTSVIVAGRRGQVAHEDGDAGVFTRPLLLGLAGQADPRTATAGSPTWTWRPTWPASCPK